MTQITVLPSEILLQIFGEIDIADIYNLKRTCRLFNEISSRSRHTCLFKVDAPGHPTWKLLKYLLRNQHVGKQITEIHVEWHRCGLGENDLFGRGQWTWTDREIGKIHDICEGVSSSTTNPLKCAIIGGINSEALLPLLLILTPNLKYLDLGIVNGELITHNPYDNFVQRDVMDTFLKLYNENNRLRCLYPSTSFEEWCAAHGFNFFSTAGEPLPPRRDRTSSSVGILCRRYFRSWSSDHIPSDGLGKTGSTWLQHCAVRGASQFPGLRSLKHFRCTTNNYSLQTDASHYHILMCQNMETVLIDGCFLTQGLSLGRRWQWEDFFYTKSPDMADVKKSSRLRKVELLRGHFTESDLELLAKMTVNLEYLAIERVADDYSQKELFLDHIIKLFLENNRKLSMGSIMIMDFTGRAWGNGSFGGIN
ncbi:hypothetical protein TWF481_008874 [Arthrobotrys musiformis]|uniref:F-box domain-containing protein n=1 Tax=Arthrobotrys musiformis TaxID=47236 RepID=A0AAV9W9Y7_9PEZI